MRDLASEIEWSKVSLLTPESYAAAATARRREPPAGLDATAMARLVAAYEEVKTERGVIDFEDVLLLMVGILREHDEVARAVRSQYRHFVVDEYQDVNRLQQTLLDLWLGERRDICVVGDPAQTIYSFTGASPEHLLGFRTRHPEARTVELVRNYRSTPQVVGLANLVLRGPGGQRRSGSVELRAQRPEGPAPELLVADNDPDEAATVATRIEALLADGHPPSEIAVLFRTNGQSEAFESALAERGIPYLVRGGERFFSRREVRDAIVLMRGAARSDDGEVPLPDLVRDVLLGAGWTREAPTSGGAARERWESLAALAALADDLHASEPEARLPVLVRELDERASAQHAPTVQGVTLASLHAAKGLEWDSVFLVGCSDGLLPITMADTPEAVEEERRLLYVGVTRARERLVLSYARRAHPGGQGHASPVTVPRRHRSRPRRGRPQPAEAAARGGRRRSRPRSRALHVPRLRRRPRHRPRAHDRPLLHVPGHDGRAAVRGAARVAAGDGPRGRRAGIRRLHRRDPHRDRRAGARPTSVGWRGITGVGPAKLERYGDDVLAFSRIFLTSNRPEPQATFAPLEA